MSASANPKVRLDHIIDQIDGIGQAIGGKSLQDCKRDFILSLAIERSLEIISEAARSLSKEWTDQHLEIEWYRIVRIGNFLRYEYHLLDENVIWDVVKNKLPELRLVIAAMKQQF